MSLSLAMTVANPRPSVFEGLRVELALANRGSRAYDLPAPDDESGALGFIVYGEDGAILLRMDGLTGQRMTSMARVDPRPSRNTLPAEGEWKWTVDLSTLHYPLAAGTYYLEARLSDPALETTLRSDAVEIMVKDAGLAALAPSRANPVLDGLALLFRAPEAEAPLILRQYNAVRPLAAWYSSPLQPGLQGSPTFCAQPAFFQTDSFDPFFRRWVIGVDGSAIWAQAVDAGEAENAPLRAPLPAGRKVVPTAFQGLDDSLHLVLSPAPGILELWRWQPSGLSLSFAHVFPAAAAEAADRDIGGIAATGARFALGADEDSLHLAWEDKGLRYRNLDWNGAVLSERRLHATRLRAEWIEFDPVAAGFRGCFRDGARGRTLQLVMAGLEGDPVVETLEGLGLRGDIGETRFQVDPAGRFHVLFVSERGRARAGRAGAGRAGAGKVAVGKSGTLYAWNRRRGLTRLADGQERYFPLVMAASRIYFGYYRKGSGYRFVEHNRGEGPRIREYR